MPCDYSKYPAGNMNQPGIYRFLNTETSQSYVGSSINVHKRRFEHVAALNRQKSHCPRLQNAWSKYGAEAFTFELLETCGISELEAREIFWVLYFNTVADGYNCSADVKVPTRGMVHPSEVRKRMSDAQKLRGRTDEEKKRSSLIIATYNASQKGVPKTEEHRRKISEANKGKRLSEEHIAKLSGRIVSEETRAKFRNRKFSAEARKKMSDSATGRTGALHRSSRPIVQLTLNGEVIQSFACTAEASRITGLGRTSIKNCLCGYTKTAFGYRWSYASNG